MSRFEKPSEALEESFANTRRQWQSAREAWNDEVSNRFEREFWSEWESVLPQTIELLRELESSLESADAVTNED